jgi:hypothetical protein
MLVRFGAGDAVHHQAIDFLKAAAAGDARSAELARALALAVGEALEPVNRLVAAVLAGGPFTIRRALELAALVLGDVKPVDVDRACPNSRTSGGK